MEYYTETNNIINYYCQVNEDVIECHTVNV